jgi:hypothetical protein
MNDFSKLPGSQQNDASARFSEAKQRQERNDTHQGSEHSEHSISDGVGCSDSQTQSHFGREEQSRTNPNESQLKQNYHDGQNISEHQNSPLSGNNKDRSRSSNSFSEAQTGAEEGKKNTVNETLHVGDQMERGGISPKVWCDLLLYLIKIL